MQIQILRLTHPFINALHTASKSLHLLLSRYWLSCSLFKLSKAAVRKFIIIICAVKPCIPIVYREYVCKFSRCLQQIEFSLASKGAHDPGLRIFEFHLNVYRTKVATFSIPHFSLKI